MFAPALDRWTYYARLVGALARRDIITGFRDTALGIFWLILRPTLLMIAFSVVRSIVRLPDDGLPYALSSFVAITAWLLHTSLLSNTVPSIQRNAGILKKIAVPRMLFPLTAAIVALFEYAVTWLPLAALLIYFQWPLHPSLAFLPLLLLLLLAFSLGIGMLIAALGVFKGDVMLTLPFVLQLWFFVSPVIYSASRLPEEYNWLFYANPMFGILEGFRDVILRGTVPDLALLMPAIIASAVIWVIAIPVYNYMSRYFADVL